MADWNTNKGKYKFYTDSALDATSGTVLIKWA